MTFFPCFPKYISLLCNRTPTDKRLMVVTPHNCDALTQSFSELQILKETSQTYAHVSNMTNSTYLISCLQHLFLLMLTVAQQVNLSNSF